MNSFNVRFLLLHTKSGREKDLLAGKVYTNYSLIDVQCSYVFFFFVLMIDLIRSVFERLTINIR